MKNFKTQLLWHLSCYWCCKTRLSWCSITFLTELWCSAIVCQVKLMFSITPIRKFVYMVLHNSMKLWADGSMEVKWCLEKLLFFYLTRGLMLLMDVSVVQRACSSLCPEICVFTSLPSSVTFAFFVRRGNIPSYDLGEPCPGEHKGCSRSELLHHPSQDRIKHRAQGSQPLSITNLTLALPSADRSQHCNAGHPCPLGSRGRALPQVTK